MNEINQNVSTIYWEKIFDVDVIHTLATKLRYKSINQIKKDSTNRLTEIIFDNNYIKNTEMKNIVPDFLYVIDRDVKFAATKSRSIEQYPNMLKFIQDNCPYIYEYIKDHKLQTLISISITISPNSLPIDIANNIQMAKQQFSLIVNDQKLSLITLIAIIKKFYSEIKNESLFSFNLNNNRAFQVINNRIDNIMNIINNPLLLQQYKINENSNCLSYRSGKQCFKFADYEIIVETNLEPYKNLIDFKILDYISNMTITSN